MKFFNEEYTYNYPFTAVCLAYFLRYPNRYALHVLATDVIERFIDPKTRRLHSTRLHLKQTKVPSSILKLLCKGRSGSNHSKSYILETSVVDPTEGWMRTESRNLEWTGILSVVERQNYQRLRASENAQGQEKFLLIRTASKPSSIPISSCTLVLERANPSVIGLILYRKRGRAIQR